MNYGIRQEPGSMSGGVRMLMAALLVAVFLGACATPSGRTPGQVIDDSSIATQINVKLLSMPGVRVLGIDVDVHQGEVILSGRAHTESEEMRIVDAVRAVDGVRKVTSLLKIIP